MGVRLVLMFEELDRKGLVSVGDLIAAEAENHTGEAPWWHVEDEEEVEHD